MEMNELEDHIRYLRKWCNEECTAPLDRVALAQALNYIRELEKELSEAKMKVDELIVKNRFTLIEH